MVSLRSMIDSDVDEAVDIWYEAFSTMAERYGTPAAPRTDEWTRRLARRMRHFLTTDPAGSFVADEGGSVIGFSQSFVREGGYWMLSLLATAPHQQGHGVGHDLLELALTNAPRDGRGTIQSSRDPSALALYTSAGFSLHPALVALGSVRPGAVAADPRVRHGDDTDIGVVDEIDRAVRGAARAPDVAAMLTEPDNKLLVLRESGYAVAQADRLITLGARTEEEAAALLRTVLAEMTPGVPIEVGWLTASQQWAIRTVVEAGVELHPHGAVMVRGMPGPLPTSPRAATAEDAAVACLGLRSRSRGRWGAARRPPHRVDSG